MSTDQPTVHQAWAAVMGEVQAVRKGWTPDKYDYRDWRDGATPYPGGSCPDCGGTGWLRGYTRFAESNRVGHE